MVPKNNSSGKGQIASVLLHTIISLKDFTDSLRQYYVPFPK